MSARKPVEVDGVVYPSITKAAEARGCGRWTLSAYIKRRHAGKPTKHRKYKPVEASEVKTPGVKAKPAKHSYYPNKVAKLLLPVPRNAEVTSQKVLRGDEVVEEWTIGNYTMSMTKWAAWAGISVYTLHSRVFKARRSIGLLTLPECFFVGPMQEPNPRSRRTTTVFITYNGKRRSLSEWAALVGIDKSTLWMRKVQLKWTAAQVLGFAEKPDRRRARAK